MKESNRTEFGARLLAARKHAQLSQTELAKRAGMSQSALGEAELTGQGSSYTAQIAKVCGINADWLASNQGEMLSPSGWPGTRFTLEQIHAWPPEIVEKVEVFALGVLAGREIPNDTVQKHSDNRLTVDRTGALVKQLSDESKKGQKHGTSDPVPNPKRSGGSES